MEIYNDIFLSASQSSVTKISLKIIHLIGNSSIQLCPFIFIFSNWTEMAPTFQLFYFAIEGRGEVVRQVFKLAGVDFKDTRFAYPNEWFGNSKFKSSKALVLRV